MRISHKHGVNPSLSTCFYCGGDKNEVILAGLLPGDREAPRRAVWSMEPCDQCKHFMEQGVILIEVDEAKSKDKDNPYRAGGWVVIKDETLRRMITPDVAERIIKTRVAFLPTEVWDALRIPRGQGTHPEGT